MARLRLMLTKGEEVRYISHLDYAKAVERALRRSKLPVAYSEGFNPHLKISFASALAVGVTSDAEYLDVELAHEVNLEKVQKELALSFGKGIKMLHACYINNRRPALTAVINLATYEASVFLLGSSLPGSSLPGSSLPGNILPESIYRPLANFNAAPSILFVKESPKGKKQIDIKNFLAGDVVISPENNFKDRRLILKLSVKITPKGSVKPADVIGVLAGVYRLPVDKSSLLINRTGLYIERNGMKISPLKF